MLLQDASESPAPPDPFRVDHVPQKKKDSVVDKPNHIMHCSPSSLAQPASIKRGYQHKIKWSEAHKFMQAGSPRLLDGVVSEAIRIEKEAEAREQRLEEFKSQRKRGTTLDRGDKEPNFVFAQAQEKV